MPLTGYFPYRALGLRGNPFRVLCGAEWAAIAVLPENVMQAIEQPAHLQFLGAKGRGKSTALRGLALHLEKEGRRVMYEYVPIGYHRFHTDPRDLRDLDVFLLDETQRLYPWEQRRLFNLAGQVRLILGTHASHRLAFAWRRQRLITVRVAEYATVEHLAAVLRARLAYFALESATPIPAFSEDAIDYLHRTFGDNLRAMERFLYDVFDTLETCEPITAAGLCRMMTNNTR